MGAKYSIINSCLPSSIHSFLFIHLLQSFQENFSLIDARQWLKGVTKGDSMLFVCKAKDGNRRFRIKFAVTVDQSSILACKSCCEVLESFFSIKEASNVASMEPGRSLSQYTMSDIQTQQLLTSLGSSQEICKTFPSQNVVSMETNMDTQPLTVPQKELSGSQVGNAMATISVDVRGNSPTPLTSVDNSHPSAESHNRTLGRNLKTPSEILQVNIPVTGYR